MRKKALVAGAAALAVLIVSAAAMSFVDGQALARPAEVGPDVVVEEIQGNAFTYQGRLDSGGSPANGTFDFGFRVYESDSAVIPWSSDSHDDVAVTDGLFTVALDFGGTIFRGDALWLEIEVRPGAETGDYAVLSPRQPLLPAPFAQALPAMRVEKNQPSPNVVGGLLYNRMAVGVQGGTIGGGGKPGEINNVEGDYGTVGGGISNTVSADNATIGGGSYNLAVGPGATIAGGEGNAASVLNATVGGGALNTASGRSSVVAGGGGGDLDIDIVYQVPNTASGNHSTVSGGGSNLASGYRSTVSGGYQNAATGESSTVGGGMTNESSGYVSTVAGGGGVTTIDGSIVPLPNMAKGDWSSIGGGGDNVAEGVKSTVAGGYQNVASGEASTVGGGDGNLASGFASTISGGGGWEAFNDGEFFVWLENRATGSSSTIGGGGLNRSIGDGSTVGGGFGNYAGRHKSTIAGGSNITVTGEAATVAGGEQITVTSGWSTVGGGWHNDVQPPVHENWESYGATISGGERNTTHDAHASIGGGAYNWAGAYGATIAGGGGYRYFMTLLEDWEPIGNVVNAEWGTIGGGAANLVEVGAQAGTVAGGMENHVHDAFGFIGGGGPETPDAVEPGAGHEITDMYGVIGGGTGNWVGDEDDVPGNAAYASILGGKNNHASWMGASICGGKDNVASGLYAAVGGGLDNGAAHDYATVAGGNSNKAIGIWATVSGGGDNHAEENWSTVAGGGENYALGPGASVGGGHANQANGPNAVVPGGSENVAAGETSFAAGHQARAIHDGSFVWCDQFHLGSCETTGNNEFLVRATGGVTFYTGFDEGWQGVRVPSGGGAWETISDRNAKENFEAVDGRDVLEALSEVPISTWSYKTEVGNARHIGPMAQDFSAAFDLGSSDTSISTVDPDGVALAAAQGLYVIVQEQESEIQELETRLAAMEVRLDALEQDAGQPDNRPSLPMMLGSLVGLMGLGLVVSRRHPVAWLKQ